MWNGTVATAAGQAPENLRVSNAKKSIDQNTRDARSGN